MKLTLPFSALTLDDVPRVGGKNASLGEMVGALVPRGVAKNGLVQGEDGLEVYVNPDPVRSGTLAALSAEKGA